MWGDVDHHRVARLWARRSEKGWTISGNAFVRYRVQVRGAVVQCPEASSLDRGWKDEVSGQSKEQNSRRRRCRMAKGTIVERNKLFSKLCVRLSTAKTVERA